MSIELQFSKLHLTDSIRGNRSKFMWIKPYGTNFHKVGGSNEYRVPFNPPNLENLSMVTIKGTVVQKSFQFNELWKYENERCSIY